MRNRTLQHNALSATLVALASTCRNAPTWTRLLSRITRPTPVRQVPPSRKTGRVTDPYARSPELARIEAALFVAQEPLPTKKLAQSAGIADASQAKMLVRHLAAMYEADGNAFVVQSVAGGWQLRTRPPYARFLTRLFGNRDDVKLSPPAIETLAIVAYRQPIMRSDIEAIRGVASSETLRHLLDRGLLKIVGHHDSLGRPVLYGTTRMFLLAFGLDHLEQLANFEKLRAPPDQPAASVGGLSSETGRPTAAKA